jgi:hypothetical protein
VLTQHGNGVWRIVLPAKGFGSKSNQLPVNRAGSYELRGHHFAQLWCDDIDIRRQAVRDRALRVSRMPGVDTLDDLHQRITPIARSLEVPAPTAADLRAFAERTGSTRDIERLDTLADAGSGKQKA